MQKQAKRCIETLNFNILLQLGRVNNESLLNVNLAMQYSASCCILRIKKYSII
jgi:hypothetical protein